jgi:hypothetical protein
MKYLAIFLILGVAIQYASACCCSRLGGQKGCEQFDDWNKCIEKPCDWLGTLKPPCEDACWEYRMKEAKEKGVAEPEKPQKKQTRRKKKKTSEEL